LVGKNKRGDEAEEEPSLDLTDPFRSPLKGGGDPFPQSSRKEGNSVRGGQKALKKPSSEKQSRVKTTKRTKKRPRRDASREDGVLGRDGFNKKGPRKRRSKGICHRKIKASSF